MLTRIADSEARKRFEAGSPNPDEVELYRNCLLSGLSSNDLSGKRILVLGMTPEIRSMALCNGAHLISIDQSKDAIDMYKDWVPEEYSTNEIIIHASWRVAGKHMTLPVDAVMGDGVFGNILSVEKHVELLRVLKDITTKNGIMIFRKALVPDEFNPDQYDAHRLIQKCRSGILSDAEFGFSMRLWGNFKNAFDPECFLLDNSVTFQCYQTWMKEGKLSETEYASIKRYYFNGLNMILSQRKWEEILVSSGYKFKCHRLTGKDWYTYYPVYSSHF